MTMGTASTMTAIAESIGMTLPGASSIPAADAGHIRMSSECGRRNRRDGVGRSDATEIQSRKAFENAITMAMAMGCSTNAIIHLIAQARRAGQDIGLDDSRSPAAGACDRQCAAERRQISDGNSTMPADCPALMAGSGIICISMR